jgi:8-oxo-dGTP pyrophosphatase MutT (NUDIX family)
VEEQLQQLLSRLARQQIQDPRLAQAAVLLPLYRHNGEHYLLFTRRTEQLPHHKGQISFPGGRYHAGDQTLYQTALRESSEEIGLRAEDVRLLGTLDDVATFSSAYVISPFVGSIPYPYPFQINPQEVAALLEIPIAALADPVCCRQEIRWQNNQPVPTYFFYVCRTDHLGSNRPYLAAIP